MRILKKICLWIVIIAMLGIVPVYAEVPSDVKDTDFEEAVSTLVDLGIIKEPADGLFKPDDTETRGEFADIIVNILGIRDAADTQKNEQVFSDVDSSNWASSSINAVNKLGIINGVGDNMFKPDDPVTYEQAVRVLVSSLGYDNLAISKGGYPSGYIIEANDLGILDKVSGGVIGEPVKRGMLAQMIYNMLDVDLMVQTQYSGDGKDSTFTVEKGKTLLTEKLNIENKTGIVNATDQTNINGGVNSTGLQENKVEIDGIKYDIGKTNAKDFLGYYVTFYVKDEKNSDEKVLLHISDDKLKNNVITVKAKDIASVSGINTPNATFKYWKNKETGNETSDVKIRLGASIFYNGKLLLASDAVNAGLTVNDLLKPSSGQVKFIDNNQDGQYELIFVTDYKTYVVDSVNDNVVYDKYEQPQLDLDKSGITKKINIIKDGKSIEVNDLSKWDVLSVAKSINTVGDTIINIIVSENTVDGKVKEISDSGTNGCEEVGIDDKNYDVCSSYPNSGLNKINVDDEGTFYLDFNGDVAGFDKSTSDGKNYAWLLKIAVPASGVDKTAEFKLFTSDSKMVVYKSTDKIDLMKADQDTYQRLNSVDIVNYFLYTQTDADPNHKVGDTKSQIIAYELNAEGLIDKITVPAASVKDGDRLDTAFFHTIVYGRNGIVSTSDSNPSTHMFYLDDTAIEFDVPDDGNEDYFNATTCNAHDLVDYDGSQFNLSGYDVSDIGKIGVVIKHLPTGTVDPIQSSDKTYPALLVNTISKGIESDGTQANIIKGWSGSDTYSDFVSSTFKTYQSHISFDSTTGSIVSAQDEKVSYTAQPGDILIVKTSDTSKEAIVAEFLFSSNNYMNAKQQAISQGINVNDPNWFNPTMIKNVYSYYTRRIDAFGKVYDTEASADTILVTLQSINPIYNANDARTGDRIVSTLFGINKSMKIGKYNMNTKKYTIVSAGEAIAKGAKLFVRMQEASVKEIFIMED